MEPETPSPWEKLPWKLSTLHLLARVTPLPLELLITLKCLTWPRKSCQLTPPPLISPFWSPKIPNKGVHLSLRTLMATPPNNFTPLKESLVFTTAPPPPNRAPTSWAKLALEGKTISHCVIIGDQLIVLLIQDPTWMAQIVKEGVDQIAEKLGYQL